MSNKIVDGVLLVPVLTGVLVKTLFAAISAPFLSTSPTYLEHISHAAARAFIGELSPTQIQLLIPAFIDSYKSYCKSKDLAPSIVPIPNTTAQGFWLGDHKTAKYHVFYIHGGGYIIPGSPAHLTMLEKWISWSNNNVAAFCIDFTLSPEAVYPLALSQCVEGLRYVLSLPNTAPSTTILAGDSAGGALVLAILSHVSSHPHPNTNIVKPLELNENLKEAILIDPFISNDSEKYSSVKQFSNRDSFDKPTADKMLSTYKGSVDIPNDEYITPVIAPASWWEATKCDSVIATAGGEEIGRDSIIDWVDKYRQGMSGKKDSVKLIIGEKETHIVPVMNQYSEAELDKRGEKVQEGALRNHIRQLQYGS